jgi:hypothetical protein
MTWQQAIDSRASSPVCAQSTKAHGAIAVTRSMGLTRNNGPNNARLMNVTLSSARMASSMFAMALASGSHDLRELRLPPSPDSA